MDNQPSTEAQEKTSVNPAPIYERPSQTSNISHDTVCYETDLTDTIKKVEKIEKQNPSKKKGKSAIIAFVLSMVLIAYWSFVFLFVNNPWEHHVLGWGFFVVSLIPLDITMSVFVLFFGSIGLIKTKSHDLAIASIVIAAIANILMIISYLST